jgi:hypothetical protein
MLQKNSKATTLLFLLSYLTKDDFIALSSKVIETGLLGIWT